jgi:hypothetical protein
MVEDFSTVYAELGEEELLQLASERSFLTVEADIALDAELRRRNLTSSDQAKHERFVKRSNQLEEKKRIRKVFGRKEDGKSRLVDWGLAICGVLIIVASFYAYGTLPDDYHFRKDWEESAEHVTWATVMIGIISTFWWRNVAFWLSLLISTCMHLYLLHSWIIRHGGLSGGRSGELAILLGIVLFIMTFGFLSYIRHQFSPQNANEE